VAFEAVPLEQRLDVLDELRLAKRLAKAKSQQQANRSVERKQH
jgi:hypothetical protein